MALRSQANPSPSSRYLAVAGLLLFSGCLLVLLADNLQPGGMVRGGPDLHHFFQRLWPFVPLLGLGFFAMRLAQQRLNRTALAHGVEWLERRAGLLCVLVIGLCLCASLAAVWVLQDFPNSGDENSYLFAARTFAAGRLWNAEPQHPEFFTSWHIMEAGGKWVSQYEPGWPAVLAAFHALGFPWWAVNPLIGASLLAVMACFARAREGAFAAIVWLGLVAFSPFYIFSAASYFNHLVAALGGALFVCAAVAWLERPGARLGFFAGAALGIVVLTRPFDVLIFAIPFAAAVLLRRDWRLLLSLGWMALGAAPFLAALMFYYKEVSGNPFVAPAVVLGPTLRIGLFPVLDSGGAFTPLDTLEDMVTLIVNLAEWTSPLLLVAYVAAMLWRGRKNSLRFFDWIFPANVLLYLLHAGPGGDRYGPRYYFEAYPFLALTIALAATGVLRRQSADAGTGGNRAAAVTGLLATHLAITVAGLAVLPYFLREMVDSRMDPYTQVARAGLGNAVVVLRSPTAGTNQWFPLNLTRNGISLDAPVIYTLDPGTRLPVLKAMFPSRHFFAYERQPEDATGYLKPL